eukprot:COSAG04_NODE_5420_length_1626_cov_1.144073_1_plen_365_part_10
MALVGDAAHTHDPLLAQGAGRAIESGVALAAAVAAWRERGQPGRETLQAAIRAEAARQHERDLLLQTLGGVASSMGQAGPAASGARQLARRHGSSSSTQDVLAKYGHQQARNPRPAADRPPVWAATNAGAKTKPPRYSEKQKMGWLAFGVLAPCCFVYSMWQGAQVINEIKKRRGVTEQEAAEPDFLASLAQDDGQAQEPQEVAEDPAAAQARAAAIARLEMQRAAVRQQRERLEAEIAELSAESAAARRDIGAETPAAAAAAAAASTAAAPEASGGAAPVAMDGTQNPHPPLRLDKSSAQQPSKNRLRTQATSSPPKHSTAKSSARSSSAARGAWVTTGRRRPRRGWRRWRRWRRRRRRRRWQR